MANPNPVAARRAKNRKRLQKIKVADLKDLQKGLTLVKQELLDRVDEDQSTEDICKLATAYTRVAAEYARIYAISEMAVRMEAIEANFSNNQKGQRGGAWA